MATADVHQVAAAHMTQADVAAATPRTREQVIGGLASAWRRVALNVGRRTSTPSPGPSQAHFMNNPLSSTCPSSPYSHRGLSRPELSSSSSVSSSSSSSASTSSATTVPVWSLSSSPSLNPQTRSGGRWQAPRWPLGRRLASAGAISVHSDGRSATSILDMTNDNNLQNNPKKQTAPALAKPRIWGAATAKSSSRRVNNAELSGVSVEHPCVSTEAAQHLAHSLQEYHFNCLKHSVLHRLKQDADDPIESIPTCDPSPAELIRPRAEQAGHDASGFLIFDLTQIVRHFCAWRFSAPLLEARYSVGANADAVVLRTMATLGVPMTCSSRADVEAASVLLARGFKATLIDVKPCKDPSHLTAALAAGIKSMTVDAEDEVDRIASRAKALGVDPSSISLVIRLRAPLLKGFAFGATTEELSHIVTAASNAGMKVVGVSLDVRQMASYEQSVETQVTAALSLCQTAVQSLTASGNAVNQVMLLGLDKLLMGISLQSTIAMYFPASSGTTVSVDASANLLENAAVLVCRVIGKRAADFSDKGMARGFHLWLSDGCYGSLGDVFLTKKKLMPHALSTSGNEFVPTVLYPTILWGPTCDGLDCIDKLTTLPELEIGDWVYYRNAACLAYGARTNFNGLTGPQVAHCFTGVANGAAVIDNEAMAKLVRGG